jgi:hypothetical protein
MKGPAKQLERIGITATDANGKVRPLWDLLGDLADRVQKNPDKAVGMAMMVLGRGGAAMVPILKQGRDGLMAFKAAFEQTGGAIDQTFVKDAKTAQLNLTLLKYSFMTIRMAMVSAFLPWLEHITHLFTAFGRAAKWARDHTYNFENVLQVLTAAGLAFGIFRLVRLVQMLGQAMGITFAEGLFPILAVIAALGLLYIIFNDIYTWVNGGDSVIGRWLDGTYGHGSSQRVLKQVKDLIKDLKTAMDPIVQLAKDVGKGLLEAFVGALPTAIRFVATAILAITEGLDTIVTAISLLFMSMDKSLGTPAERWEKIKAEFGKYAERGTNLTNMVELLGKPGQVEVKAPLAYGGAGLPPPPNPNAMYGNTSGVGVREGHNITIQQHFKNDPGKPGEVKEAAKQGVRTALGYPQGFVPRHVGDTDDAYAAVGR